MKRFVEQLSPRAEFWVITTIAFGSFVVGSLAALAMQRRRHLGDRDAIALVGFELCVLLLVGVIGRLRGWSFRTLGLHPTCPTWGQTGAGLLLYLATVLSLGVLYQALTLLVPSIPPPNVDARGLSWVGVLLVSLVNPLYEELLVTGYVMSATAHEGAGMAITASAVLRFLYHAYQGPAAAVAILPLGLIFAAVYWRYRKLWPLIIAHAIMDILALWQLARA